VREINKCEGNKINLLDNVVGRIYLCYTFRVTIHYACYRETSAV
jgi:hypothetical protein